ncbi:MAG: hypothetical protein P8182_15035, partial [Deltaproteobacteria bacterium]
MRVIRILSLSGLAFVIALVSLDMAHSQETAASLLKQGFGAIESGRLVLAREKLKDVLKVDPGNYQALVILGQLEMIDLAGPDRAKRMLDSERYFLSACVAQPQRPEADLGLAQLCYDTGYFMKGDRYARTAQAVDPGSYEAFCLIGQRLLDSGNYTGALDLYSRGLKHYGFDAYFTERRYLAAARGGLDPQWIVIIPSGGEGNFVLQLPRYPDFYLLREYRSLAGSTPDAGRHYALPMFTFKHCPREVVPPSPYRDLYEAYLRASVDDPRLYRRLRSELDRLRTEARKVVAKVEGKEEKGKALYNWLKTKMLKKYDVKEGLLAQDLLEKKRYASLNASILYTLLARELGLPVEGVIGYGHAFSEMAYGKREIRIELIAEPRFGVAEKEGFDIGWWDQFKILSRPAASGGLRDSARYRLMGRISPRKLTAYQFLNAHAYNLGKIAEQFKEEVDYKKTLEEMIVKNNREAATRLAALESRYQREPKKRASLMERTKQRFAAENRKLQREIEKIDYKLERERTKYLQKKGVDLIKKARSLAPHVEEFVERQEQANVIMAEADVRPAVDALKGRRTTRRLLEKKLSEELTDRELEKRLSGRQSAFVDDIQERIDAIESEIRAIQAQGTRSWTAERAEWLKAVDRLTKALKELPCSDKIRKRLESFCWTAARLAERYGDTETVDAV